MKEIITNPYCLQHGCKMFYSEVGSYFSIICPNGKEHTTISYLVCPYCCSRLYFNLLENNSINIHMCSNPNCVTWRVENGLHNEIMIVWNHMYCLGFENSPNVIKISHYRITNKLLIKLLSDVLNKYSITNKLVNGELIIERN